MLVELAAEDVADAKRLRAASEGRAVVEVMVTNKAVR